MFHAMLDQGGRAAWAADGTHESIKRRRRPAGFTLVELLVVVSIIALLISILLPSLHRARDQAKSVKCLAHQRGMAQASLVFTGDHNSRFQLAATEGDALTGVNSADPNRSLYEYDRNKEILAWPVAIARTSGISYTANWDWAVRGDNFQVAMSKQAKMRKDFELAQCPADKVRISTPFFPRGSGLKGTGDPNDPMAAGGGTTYWGYLSFGINEDIVGSETKSKNGQAWPACWKDGVQGESDRPDWATAGVRLRGNMERVFGPSSVLMVVDAGPNTEDEALAGLFSNDDSQGRGFANLITSAKARGPYLQHATSQWKQRIPTKRHPGGAINVVFADFHASVVQPTAWRFDTIVQSKIPSAYSEQVRVSPYKPD